MDYPYGTDISKYNHNKDDINLTNFDLMNLRCDFIAVRAGISWGYIDPCFHDSWERIYKPRLAYHVIYPGESGQRQADHFLNIVKPTEHDRLVLDAELVHGLSKEKITDTFIEALNYIWDNTGRYPIMYSRAQWVNLYLNTSRLPKLDWWLAGYLNPKPEPQFTPELPPPPALPKGVSTWLIHQTAEKSKGKDVGVFSHYVDSDRWNGTKQSLLSYFGLTEEAPPPEEPPQEKLFDARVYSWATPHVNIRKEPDIRSKDLGDILPNEIVPVYGDLGTWYEVQKGFVMKRFLEKLDGTPEYILIDMPPLWQNDPRWKNLKLGNSNLTIGGWGCTLSCLSIIAGVTPDVFNERLKAVGGFAGANIYWKMVEVAYPYLRYLKAIDCYYDPAPLDEIDNYLRLGITSLVQVDLNPSTPQMDQHWVQINGKDGSDYIANDPLTGKRISFKNTYGDPARWIFRVRVYENTKGV